MNKPDTILAPDLAQAKAFLNKLDPRATSWTFQTFDDNPDRRDQSLARVYHGTMDEHAVSLANMQSKGAGVYVTVNETDGKGRKAENVTRIRALFLDLDGAPLEPVNAWEEPHIICETSPGRWHAYWLVKDCPLDRFRAIQQDLIATFGGDKCIHDLPRVMRLPGFYHLKAEPVMVRMMETGAFPAPFTVNAFSASLEDALGRVQETTGGLPLSARATPASPPNGFSIDTGTRGKTHDDYARLMQGIKTDGEKHASVRDLTASMAARGRSKPFVENFIREHCPVYDSNVQRLIDSAFDKYAKSKEPDLDAPEPRSYEELLEAAKALKPGQVEDMEAIVAEAAPLKPMRRELVFRAIKDATKTPLTTLRAQVEQDREVVPEPDHLDLARVTIDHVGRENVICTNAFVWRWQDRGVWTPQDDRAIKQTVQECLDGEAMIAVTATLVNGVTDVMKSDIYRPEHEFNLGNPETVNCLTGELELQTGHWTLRPHSRENYRTTQIPVEYDPTAEAPLFWAFLGQVFRDDPDRDDKMHAALELMGYTAMSHARHERFIMLIGPGANGKSVLLSILERMLGVENVAGVQPANFDNRFQRAHLHQKLANIVTELKQGEVIADAELKAITSGEPATVEHKHKDPFVMRPFATCWFGTNHMPHTRDFSEALFRRATILQFNRTFAPDEQDPLLRDKLLTELPGILNMALTAYARALVNGFTQPQSSEDAKMEWRLEADQVALFVDDACERDPHGRAPAGDVFQAYKAWAFENGISKTMSQKGLRDRLTRLGFGADRDMRARYVLGLRVSYQTYAV